MYLKNTIKVNNMYTFYMGTFHKLIIINKQGIIEEEREECSSCC